MMIGLFRVDHWRVSIFTSLLLLRRETFRKYIPNEIKKWLTGFIDRGKIKFLVKKR